ncbi:hypothetical protein F4X10_04970 [Candidatus Poribacteria bacterium]|nr:hypothetical protein [Candidatus Poribacteria bacterium]
MFVPLLPINQEKLSRILQSEFELWVHNFDQRPIPEAQELRAFFVQWFAVFAPECFKQALIDEISAFACETKQHVDFRRRKWYGLLPIEVALYALSSDSSWINMARANLNHHNSSLRSLVLESLLLVVDKLRFDDPYLLAPVTDNLERSVFYDTDTALFLCMAQGEPEMKHIQIKRWLDQVNMSTNAREKLQALSDGKFVPNPFLHHVTQWTCYILLRLASQETPSQPTLFLEIPNEFQLKFPIILGWVIKQRMMEHPLFQPFIRLEQVKT